MRSEEFSFQSLEARTLFTTAFTVSFADNGSFSQYHADIQRTILAAGAEWASKIPGTGTVDVQVMISGSIPTAQTQSLVSVPVGTSQDGFELDQQGAAYEMQTGIDPNGSAPDVQIEIGASYLTNDLWFDPDPTTRATPVPADKIDAYSVLLHELAHGLGFNGARDRTTGSLTGTAESTFDQWVRKDSNGNLFFAGPNAEAANGGNAIPLTAGNMFHVGNSSGPGADLVNDLMNGVTFVRGQRYDASAIDLGILKDTFNASADNTTTQSRTVIFSQGKPATYTDSQGHLVTVSLKGIGNGTITFASSGNVDPDSVAISGTNPKTTMTIKANGPTTIQTITGTTVIGSIEAPAVSVTNGMNVWVSSKLNLAAISNAAVSLGTYGSLSMTIPSITDSTISLGTLKSFKGGSFSGNTVNVSTLTSFTAGAVTGSTFRASNIGTFTATSIDSSHVYAGVDVGLDGIAVSSADFPATGAIKTFKIKSSFTDSFVSAANLGKMTLGFVNTGSSDNEFGLAGKTISSVAGATPLMKKLKLKKNQVFSEAEFEVNVVT